MEQKPSPARLGVTHPCCELSPGRVSHPQTLRHKRPLLSQLGNSMTAFRPRRDFQKPKVHPQKWRTSAPGPLQKYLVLSGGLAGKCASQKPFYELSQAAVKLQYTAKSPAVYLRLQRACRPWAFICCPIPGSPLRPRSCIRASNLSCTLRALCRHSQRL